MAGRGKGFFLGVGALGILQIHGFDLITPTQMQKMRFFFCRDLNGGGVGLVMRKRASC